MAKKRHLIIGCGSAGLAALETIRSITSEDEIKVVTAERHAPYSPTALPYLLSGRIQEDNFWMRPPSYFKKLNAVFETGKKAMEILPERKEVGFQDGTVERYDALLIATGAEPAKPPIKGLEGAGFQGFRTFDDYKRLMQQLESKRDVAILGAGLVGMEVAMGLVERGFRVNVVARSRILRAYFDVEAEAVIREIFESKGVVFSTGHEINEVRASGSRMEIALAGNNSFEVDLVVTAMGVVPRTELLQGSGVKLNNGIPVDRHGQTSVHGVFAAGDVAEAFDFFTGKPTANPIIPSAIAQGKIAGASMAHLDAQGSKAEKPEAYEGSISMNVFNFFGNIAFSIGLSTVADSGYEILKEHDERQRQLRKLVFKDEHLVGVMMMNVGADPGIFHYLIRNRVALQRYKEALFENPKDVGRWLMLNSERGDIEAAQD